MHYEHFFFHLVYRYYFYVFDYIVDTKLLLYSNKIFSIVAFFRVLDYIV